MRKNKNSGFYLINYAKIRVKMTHYKASQRRQDASYKTEVYSFKSILGEMLRQPVLFQFRAST